MLDEIRGSLKKNKKILIVTPNPEIMVHAQGSKKLLVSLNSADISICDGIGLLWALKLLKKEVPERFRGRELMIDLLKIANDSKLKVYFLGASDSVNRKAVNLAKEKYPKAKILGASGPWLDDQADPVTDFYNKHEIEVVNHINDQKPAILLVAFGAPKQEIWAHKWRNNLDVTVIMTVGGAFDYFAGTAVVPPIWVARVGLEWLWRLLREPRRFKRIINALVTFPLLVLKERFLE